MFARNGTLIYCATLLQLLYQFMSVTTPNPLTCVFFLLLCDCSDPHTGVLSLVCELMDMNAYELIKGEVPSHLPHMLSLLPIACICTSFRCLHYVCVYGVYVFVCRSQDFPFWAKSQVICVPAVQSTLPPSQVRTCTTHPHIHPHIHLHIRTLTQVQTPTHTYVHAFAHSGIHTVLVYFNTYIHSPSPDQITQEWNLPPRC